MHLPSLSRREFAALLVAAPLAGCAASGNEGRLRVADQLKILQTTVEAAGPIARTTPVAWANFVGGPSIIAAATGDSIDLGWMAETPLVFAQAAGSPVKVVAVARAAGDQQDAAGIAIVVRKGSPLRTAADLKGKRIIYSQGTITQYFTLRALEQAGLSLKDVDQVTVTPGVAATLLKSGQVDALVTVEPYLSPLLVPGDAQVLVRGGAPLTPELWYLVAPDAALADPGRSALIGRFIGDIARAFDFWRANPEKATEAAARLYRLSPPVARSVVERTARQIRPLDSDVIAAQQREADAFHAIGLIPRRVDATALYDRRFDPLLAAQGKAA